MADGPVADGPVADGPRPSPLALAVLGLLSGGPLHPYGIQRLIREWGKDQVVNVGQRANLYKTIKRLHEAGLIAVRQTERDQQYPERTVYEATGRGLRLAREWLTDMLSAPRNEFPQFPAALSFLMLLGPQGSRDALAQRAERLRTNLVRLNDELGELSGALPRVAVVETEYQRAMVSAELAWVNALVDELASGALSWTAEELEQVAPTAYDID